MIFDLTLICADLPFMIAAAAAMMMRLCQRHCVALVVQVCRANPLALVALDTGCDQAKDWVARVVRLISGDK